MNMTQENIKIFKTKFYLANPKTRIIISTPFDTAHAADDAISVCKEVPEGYILCEKKEEFKDFIPIRGTSVQRLLEIKRAEIKDIEL
jgi:hypothetical protein